MAFKFFRGATDSAVVMNDALPINTVIRPDDAFTADGEILTVEDLSKFLRVPKSTVYKLARIGELPASKIGKHWRFLRRDIHEWMRSRSASIPRRA